MEGIYSPAQLNRQKQQRQPNAGGSSAPIGALPNENTNDNMVIDDQPHISRQSSVQQQYPSAAAQNHPDDVMMYANQQNTGTYPYAGQVPTSISAIDTTNVGPYGNGQAAYSASTRELMGTMISPQFADMDMAAMFQSPTASAQYPTPASAYFDINNRQPGGTTPLGANTPSSSVPSSNAPSKMDKPVSGPELGLRTTEAPQAPAAPGVMDEPTGLSRESSTAPKTAPDPIQATNSSVNRPFIGPAREKTMYSKSGFDMLKALWLVATRKNPKVNLGAVDMSCAFVVTDVTMNDCPIVYVSDNFQNLTGYSQHDIVGQNCRFLQSPDGKVEAGKRREFVDNQSVYNLKKSIEDRVEIQQSLINYRKGGKPFLNLLTMIPIPWDTEEIRYFIGFQIDLVECPDAIASGQELGRMTVNYKHTDIGQYIWTPPNSKYWEVDNGQTLGADDVSTLLQQFNPTGVVSDWHKQSWDKMLLENSDDIIHVLSLKGLFLYLSPACKRILEYDGAELVGNSLSSICHPSDIVPVTRELKDATAGSQVNIVFRIRRKQSGYTWFESRGSLYVEHGKGRKCIILVGRKRPVFALSRRYLDAHGGIGDSEIWTKMSTSGMFLFVSSNVRSLLDLHPDELVGTSIQELMRKESRPEFGRAMEKARRGKIVTCRHEMQNNRGQGLQAQTILYPGDATEGQKPSFFLAQTRLVKSMTRNISSPTSAGDGSTASESQGRRGTISEIPGGGLVPGDQDEALASDDNIFDELRTTKCSSWQFELRQMEKVNRILAEELAGLLSNKKKRKRRKGVGNFVRDCANCHTRSTPEWRRGPSGQRDLCNSCGLRWAKQMGRVSPRTSSRGSADGKTKKSRSPLNSSPLHKEVPAEQNAGTTVPTTQDAPAPATSMLPPSAPLASSAVSTAGMTSIREERETS
ncbi:Putative White collar 1-like protein [[Torrubiella] hemipterigena]|uniref:Putative White collar 1-like protein n=1 Tax=[Torrubiella] hemipterigena TaxID=1531966 RepID=A0A0A1SR09_9HYPO|nr:Putative White collar 1-like protein [[Torrubiella] hemipterigena]